MTEPPQTPDPAQRAGPLFQRLATATRAADLQGHARRVADLLADLHACGTDSMVLGRLVADLGDALADRLLVLAETELGPPPVPYAWIVFGSEGRREQSFLTDQDNALVFADAEDAAEDGVADDASEAAGTYFADLARWVVDGLLQAGVPECPGGFMATHWCLPLSAWRRRFASWIDQPDPEHLLRVSILFDWRPVHGDLDLEPLEQVVRDGRRNHRFLAQLARAALAFHPPLGLFHRVVECAGGIDLKAGALLPIVGLARLFALEAGHRAGSTLDRLARAVDDGVLSRQGGAELADAFRFAFDLRLRRQLDDHRADRDPDPHGHLHQDALDRATRRHLKQAFLAIDRVQRATELRLLTGPLG